MELHPRLIGMTHFVTFSRRLRLPRCRLEWVYRDRGIGSTARRPPFGLPSSVPSLPAPSRLFRLEEGPPWRRRPPPRARAPRSPPPRGPPGAQLRGHPVEL